MVVGALLMAIILACVAEVASQFSDPGGACLYTRTAFGRFTGIQVRRFWLLSSIAGGAATALRKIAARGKGIGQSRTTELMGVTALIAAANCGGPIGEPRPVFKLKRFGTHLIAIGLIGDPTAPVMASGGAQNRNSYTLSLAQSSARSLR